MPADVDVTHQPGRARFVARIDGQRCVLEYRLAGRTMTITHTEVPVALRGRGIAGAMTRAALETARAEGWKVVPACSYAARFLQAHGGYRDLLA